MGNRGAPADRFVTMGAVRLLLLLAALQQPQPQRRQPAFVPIKDDPALPRVLLLGDSMSVGYTLPVRAMLKPIGAGSRIPGDAAKYNEAAAKIMKEEKVPVNDLHAFAKERLAEIQRPANVHFTKAGSEKLAARVVEQIRRRLGP